MSIQSLHNVFIILHAASAVISFFAGCFLILSLRNTLLPRWFSLYWWFLVGLVLFLAGAILVYWAVYSSIERIVFPALFILGLYMLYRAQRANHSLQVQENTWKHDTVEHIGFTLISLFEGFIIVGGLDLGIPGWLVAIAAILGVFAGRWLIGSAQRGIA